jgi:hypothetical protein
MNDDYKRVMEYFDLKFTKKDLIDKGFSRHQAESVIESMLQSGMICEDVQCPAKKSDSSNIYQGAGTVLYWILAKDTDETDLTENFEEIKNNDDMMVVDGEGDDEEESYSSSRE